MNSFYKLFIGLKPDTHRKAVTGTNQTIIHTQLSLNYSLMKECCGFIRGIHSCCSSVFSSHHPCIKAQRPHLENQLHGVCVSRCSHSHTYTLHWWLNSYQVIGRFKQVSRLIPATIIVLITSFLFLSLHNLEERKWEQEGIFYIQSVFLPFISPSLHYWPVYVTACAELVTVV